MEQVSELSVQRLMAQRADVVEDHALALAQLREAVMNTDDMANLKLIEERVDALVKCIKAERLCYGLPSEIEHDSSFETTLGYIGKTKRENLYKAIKRDLKYGLATGDDKSNKKTELRIDFKH